MIETDLSTLAVPIASLKLMPGNPRRGDVEAVARSLARFGQRKPVVARRSDSVVIAGNHTLLAARSLDWSEIAVVWTNDDDATAKAYSLADNRTAELGGYDDAELAAMIAEVADFDDELLLATGWNADDLDKLLASSPSAHETALVLEDSDEVSTEAISWGIFEQDEVIETAFKHYRKRGFPYRAFAQHESMQEINQLAGLDESKLLGTTLGYGVADTYHRHRFEARVATHRTTVESFESDQHLRLALGLSISEHGKITDANLANTLAHVRGTQAASNFRPGYALSMYRRFAFDGAVVLDTSTGYGGRLVGFLASTCARYIGIDPNTETTAGNTALAIDMHAGDRVQLICLPAEDVDGVGVDCDFAFTSPPYFSKEHYSDEATQSCNRYESGDEWRDGFLRPMMVLQYRSLKADRYAVVNIADVKLGSTTYPLVDWTCEAAQDAGFELVRKERFPLGRVPGSGIKAERFEPVLIFRKP